MEIFSINLRWSIKTLWIKISIGLISVLPLLILLSFKCLDCDEWGFFGHRRINRLAVFTLPPEMMPFFREHIDFITDHAIDPDKRRYATRHEAVRHYIDLDEWGEFPFDKLPRQWNQALACFTDLYLITDRGDSIKMYTSGSHIYGQDTLFLTLKTEHFPIPFSAYVGWFSTYVLPQYYEDEWIVEIENLFALDQEIMDFIEKNVKYKNLVLKDRFSTHGILPYHLVSMQSRLTEAFRRKDTRMILRLATDFGHYIGDAHVPLHTTKNYNGQLTKQDGIHAFWESRIPELFADEYFDYFVGRAEYIRDPERFYWNIVLESHLGVDSVLSIEKRLRKTFPPDRQMCMDNRLGQVVNTQCREFAQAYNEALRGQIEERFRSSIHAIGSAWYTAWVDAGQPSLKENLKVEWTEIDKNQKELEEKMYQKGQQFGRAHEN